MTNIVVFIDTEERYIFFKNLCASLEINTFFITNKYLLYKKYGLNLIRNSFSKLNDVNTKFYKDSLDYKINAVSKKQSTKLAHAIYHVLDENQLLDTQTIYFLWNGSRSHDKVLKYLAKLHGCKILYFEQPNIPGYTIIDPKGIGPKSSLLAWYEQDSENRVEIEEMWIKIYFKKYVSNPVPQAILKDRYIYYMKDRAINYFMSIIYNIPQTSYKPFALKFYNNLFYVLNHVYKKILKNFSKPVNKIELSGKFLFLPMQISSDSQIVLNSTISVKESVRKAAEYCKLYDMTLMVKHHPADIKPVSDKYIKKLCKRMGVNSAITTASTYDLIEKSAAVMVINSNVGFESILLSKKTIYLGDSIFKNADLCLINFYINKYLFKIDYFNPKPLTKSEVDEFKRRYL